MILFQIVFPYLGDRAGSLLHSFTGNSESHPLILGPQPSRFLVLFKKALPHIRQVMTDQVRSLHLAVFYLVGTYYHLSKRATNIRYASIKTKSVMVDFQSTTTTG